MPTPKKGRRLGGSSSHQRSMMANLAASLFAAEAIETTEAKAKAVSYTHLTLPTIYSV